MKLNALLILKPNPLSPIASWPSAGCLFTIGLLLALALPRTALGSENVPHQPYGDWANVPKEGEFTFGLRYDQSSSYHIWASGKQYDVKVTSGGEYYGIDNTQGYVTLQYGITERWAADLGIGYATEGWRKFSANNSPQSTGGLMDSALGVRYQLFNEANAESPWTPTLTFRAGAVLPGTYDQSFIYAPGNRSAAIEPELIARKHFGWPGLGAYGDVLYRWNMTTANDLYIASVGLFQQIKGWEVDVGYQRLQTTTGNDIVYDPNNPSGIIYPRDPREIRDVVQAGFSYITRKQGIKYGFNTSIVVDGNNSDAKFWLGATVEFRFGGKKSGDAASTTK
jgi:hypothetical protein